VAHNVCLQIEQPAPSLRFYCQLVLDNATSDTIKHNILITRFSRLSPWFGILGSVLKCLTCHLALSVLNVMNIFLIHMGVFKGCVHSPLLIFVYPSQVSSLSSLSGKMIYTTFLLPGLKQHPTNLQDCSHYLFTILIVFSTSTLLSLAKFQLYPNLAILVFVNLFVSGLVMICKQRIPSPPLMFLTTVTHCTNSETNRLQQSQNSLAHPRFYGLHTMS